jgi:hypothetical protein
VTAIVLFLGFNAYRRQLLIAKAEYFKRYNVEIVVPSDFSDFVWQRNAHIAVIDVNSEYFKDGVHTKSDELVRLGITEQRLAMPTLKSIDWGSSESE